MATPNAIAAAAGRLPASRTSDLAAAREATLDAIGAVERARFTLTRSRRLGNSDHPAARALTQALCELLKASEALSQDTRATRQAAA